MRVWPTIGKVFSHEKLVCYNRSNLRKGVAMEPICMYFADLSVQYRRKVRKETGAQASYFVGVIKDSDEAHVKAYLSKSAKTPVSEFTVKFRLNDANSISQRKVMYGATFFIDSGDPSFHDFQMKMDFKDRKQFVMVKLPYLYGVGSIPADFYGYCRNLVASCGSVDKLTIMNPLAFGETEARGYVHLGKGFEITTLEMKIIPATLEFYTNYRPWLGNGVLDICAYPLEYAGNEPKYNELYHTAGASRVFVEPVNNPQSVQKFILNAAEDVWRALPDYMEYGSLRVDRNGGGEMYPFDPVRKIASGPLAISTDALPRFHAELDRFGLWSGWKRSSECSDMWLQRLPRQSAFVGKRELRHVPGFEGKYGCIIRLEGRKGH